MIRTEEWDLVLHRWQIGEREDKDEEEGKRSIYPTLTRQNWVAEDSLVIFDPPNCRRRLRSHAVSTERTILSPFTKEYRVLAANSGIRQFLERSKRGLGFYKCKFELLVLQLSLQSGHWTDWVFILLITGFPQWVVSKFVLLFCTCSCWILILG
jgi:hypothetical protein